MINKFFLIILLSFYTFTPYIKAAAPASCNIIGVNYAVDASNLPEEYLTMASDNGMGWVLFLVSKDPGRQTTLIRQINTALSLGLKPIVRIGSGHETFGFSKDPLDWANYLNQVRAQTTGSFWAIVGPNDHHAEDWFMGAPYNIGEEGKPDMLVINEVGSSLSVYMNTVIAKTNQSVKLLSPAFNLSSWSGEYIIKAMVDSGAKFDQLWGYAGNAYSLHDYKSNDIEIQTNKLIDSNLGYKLPEKKIILTEFGNKFSESVLAEDIMQIKSGLNGIYGVLLFNAFNTNGGWAEFTIKDFEGVLGKECVTKKPPVDLAKFLPPATIPCIGTVNPEYHNKRPYPFNPCDPLIPGGAKDAKEVVVAEKKNYTSFACGNPLVPKKITKFDPYGDNYNDENLHCEKDNSEPPLVTCYRSEEFDLEIDLGKANLGLISNTQDSNLTDEQKVNEYLSWYLSGSYQMGKFEYPNTDKMLDFSGPLRKLIPSFLLDTAKKTVKDSSGTEVHSYLERIIKSMPFTSPEDAVGEYVVSVYPPGAPGNPQDLNVLGPNDSNNLNNKGLKLIITSAEKAKK